MAQPDPTVLADCVFSALNDNGYGQYDHLIERLRPASGAKGLNHLKGRFIELSKTPIESRSSKKRKVTGWGMAGSLDWLLIVEGLAMSGSPREARSWLWNVGRSVIVRCFGAFRMVEVGGGGSLQPA